VTAVVGTTGSVLERYAYDPYGVVTIMSPSWSALGASAYGAIYLWQGKRYDGFVGLYDSRARVYSPSLMRPLQADPLGLGPDVNDYRWEGDGPTNTTDASGLFGVFLDGAGQDGNNPTKRKTDIFKLFTRYSDQKKYFAVNMFINRTDSLEEATKWAIQTWESLPEEKKKTEKVDLFGWSRGGVYAVKVAQALKEKNIPVRSLVIIDQVSTMCGTSDFRIPSNVDYLIWAYRDGNYGFMGGLDGLIFKRSGYLGFDSDRMYIPDDNKVTTEIHESFSIRHEDIGFDGEVEDWLLKMGRQVGVPLPLNPGETPRRLPNRGIIIYRSGDWNVIP
jgi:RHS repeat-associated protein